MKSQRSNIKKVLDSFKFVFYSNRLEVKLRGIWVKSKKLLKKVYIVNELFYEKIFKKIP